MKYLDLARKLSYASTAKQQKMAAVIVRGGAIVSIGINHKWNHAETRAIRPHRHFQGCTIYVMRSNGRCSRPCLDCQRKIIQAGIERAVYIALDGIIVTERYLTAP